MKNFSGMLLIPILLSLAVSSANVLGSESSEKFSRKSFPSAFIFGSAGSAYQFEGGANKDGRKPSVWDLFSHTPGSTVDGSNGDVAVDQYHQYKEDVKMMAKMGTEAYRFSISWSRLLPYGRGEVNPLGVNYYNNLIDELVTHGIKPFVGLYHFDLPQILQDEYLGFLSPRIVDDFAEFAEVCFRLFGDRVKHWITINEPNLNAILGFDTGTFPPSRCSKNVANCSAGNSTIEPYIVGHNQILCHLAAKEIYNSKFTEEHKGSVGITVSAQWYEPLTNTSKDLAAVDRTLEFTVAWILDPLFFGEYPTWMREIVGSRLPTFTAEESARLRNAKLDFVGLNHYTTNYVYDIPATPTPRSYLDDMAASRTGYRGGVAIGPKASLQSIIEMDFCVPRGIRCIVLYVTRRYNSPEIYITENGLSENRSLAECNPREDTERVQYHQRYLKQLWQAMREGAQAKGYFVWSLMDNFEFKYGFTMRYGLLYVDRSSKSLQRFPKASANWYRSFLTSDGHELLRPRLSTLPLSFRER